MRLENAKHNEVQMLIGANELNAKQILHRIITHITFYTPLPDAAAACVCCLGQSRSGCDVSCLMLQWIKHVTVWRHVIFRAHVYCGWHSTSATTSICTVRRVSGFQESWGLHLHTSVHMPVYIHAFLVENTAIGSIFIVEKQKNKEMSFFT